MQKVRVLLDTDIGSDIDDAVALAYLVGEPRCELVGVRTVSGQSLERAKLVSVLLRHWGIDVPIVVGRELPLSGVQLQPQCPESRVLSRWPHDRRFGEELPDKDVLLSIGPLTNVALEPAHARHYMMGGRFLTGGDWSEWNCRCDGEAARIVFCRAEPVTAIGLDVTSRLEMNRERSFEFLSGDALAPVRDMAEEWLERNEVMRFHDVIAAAAIFHDDVCSFESGRVSVHADGITTFQADPEGPHRVATSLHADRFLYVLSEALVRLQR